jgi:hypothetical protein
MPQDSENSGAFLGGSGGSTSPSGPRARNPLQLAPGFKPVMLVSMGWIALTISAAYVTEKNWPSPRSAAPTMAAHSVVGSKPIAVSVRFTNPFDESEVFEFPAGTSGAEAQDAVARTLLERARKRLATLHLHRHTAATGQTPARLTEEPSMSP